MKDDILIGHDVESGGEITVNVESLIKNRGLTEGDSGSGKSHLLTVMIEGTDKKAQRIIIDIEGEYFTLKNNFQFLLIGKSNETVKTDIELNLGDVYVEKLAKKVLEKSIDTIIDLSEYPNEATHFVSIFFKAILKHSKVMTRPLLIFLDEAHIFAPEKGSGNEESLRAVIELAKRGRKRGIGLICGTQAIADFSKNVVRQLRTRFIGNCNYDKDIKTASHYLGFGKDREQELTKLGDDHNFFATGQGMKISGKKPNKVLKIKAISTKTKLYDFKFDKKTKIKDKNPNMIKYLKKEFEDIPQQLENELDEKEKLKQTVDDLRQKLISIELLDKTKPLIPKVSLTSAYENGKKETAKDIVELMTILKSKDLIISLQKELLEKTQKGSEIFGERLSHQAVKLLEEIRKLPENKSYVKIERKTEQKEITMDFQNTRISTNETHFIGDTYGDVKLSGPENRIMTALIQRKGRATKKQIALISVYAVNGGGFRNLLSHLKSLGLLQYEGDYLVATAQAENLFSATDPIGSTNANIQDFWLSKLSGPESKILRQILTYYPDQVSKNEVAIQTVYEVNGGGFRNILSHLKSLGLIEYINGNLKASKELFPNE